jgi:TonB-dependent starch-binding outer membrane protein SusC
MNNPRVLTVFGCAFAAVVLASAHAAGAQTPGLRMASQSPPYFSRSILRGGEGRGGTAADTRATATRGTPWTVPVTPSDQVSVMLAEGLVTGAIAGKVIDRGTQQPLPAAQIVVEGTVLSAVTADDGTFRIAGVAPGHHRITARRIGYQPQSATVTVVDDQTVDITIALGNAPVSLSEVVVTATGEEQKKTLGNSIATIDTAQVQRQAATNTQQILAGSTPGVTVLANSGQPGAGGTLRLRGVNSISQGNSPLIYVDGVRVFNGSTPTSIAGRQFVNPLNDIPAEDIDHIDIVKGPAATTLYGTEASGGVIQIFTKRGREGARWSFNATSGFTNMGHVGPKSDPTGLGFNECRGANLVNGDGVKYEDPTCPANGSWLSNGPIQRYSASVRGGDGTANYFAAGNANTEHGVLPTGGNHDQSLRANIGFTPAKHLTVDLNSSVVNRRVDWYPDGNSGNGALLNISRRSGSNFKGPGCIDATAVCVSNDSIFTSSSYTSTNHFTTGGTFTYAPTEHWSSRAALGYDYNNADITTITPFGHLRVPLGQYFETLWNRQMLSLDMASTYRHVFRTTFGSTSSIGGQVFDSRLHSTDLQSNNFAGPGDPTLVTGSLRTINGVDQQRVINAGIFGQQMISWRDLLFVTAGLRVDGNSAFGKSFGLQSYPKVSASYVASDEPRWPFKFVIQTFRMRGAFGESGKAPGAFDAVRTWSPVAAENGHPAFTPSQIGNPNLGPERTREVEVGFDATALDGRVNVIYTHYDQHTYDALIPVQQAPSLGFAGSQLLNVGQLNNHGNELTLTTEVVRRADIAFTAKLNYTTFVSQAGDIGGNPIVIDALNRTNVVEGFPVPSYFGILVRNGRDFADPDTVGNQYLGSTFPNRIVSPNLTLRLFERLTLDALGEWQRGGHNLNAVGYQNANLHSWQPCYEIQNKLRAAAAGDASALSGVRAIDRAKCTLTSTLRDYSYWVEASDFFKLRSVSITYDLPTWLLRGAHGGSVTFAGRNLLTRTNYDGSDPEVSDQRDNTFSRRDYYVFPTYRTFTVALRASF